jgi:RNA polymerase sigma-70 factor (ECF subfamily)
MSSMPSRDHVDVEGLAAQVAWVRSLAVAIARDAGGERSARISNDAHAADDLAQDAWVAALRRRPDASEQLTSWFARVMRNLARFRKRSDANRLARERASARPECDDSAALAIERMETQEVLLRAVRELDEPYRTTVILRWFEGLEPSEIALRSDVPVRTVHTRITRALRMLRDRLDRGARGDRLAWSWAWIPLISKPARNWPWILAMDAKLKIAIASAVAVGALTALYVWVPTPPTPNVSGTTASVARASELDAPAHAAEPIESRASAVDVAGVPAPSHPPAAQPADAPRFEFDAVVLDTTGNPVADLDVEFRATGASSATERARTGADGLVHFAVVSANGTLAPASGDWTTVLEPRVRPSKRGARYVLVVAPLIALEGRVVDDRGHPIAGAGVRCMPPPVRERLALVLDDCAWLSWKSTTDAEGRFRLPIVPAIADAQLVGEAAGYTRDARPMPQTSRSDVEIRLTWPSSVASHVRGQVLDIRGAGIDGAHVGLGERSVRTDAAGRFDLDLERPVALKVAASTKKGEPATSAPSQPEPRTLRALKRGFLPKDVECATPSPRDIGAWPDPVLIVLDSESLSIAGRVVDDLGAPIAGADVWVLDLTEFAEVDFELGEKRFAQTATVESLLSSRSDGQMAWLSTKTEAAGRFEHDGLLSKSYRLRAFDPKSMVMVITKPVMAPQTDLEIVLGNASKYARIAGRVVDRDDRPVANAAVRAEIYFGGQTEKIGLYGMPSSRTTKDDSSCGMSRGKSTACS